MESALDGTSSWRGGAAGPVMTRTFLEAGAALAAILAARYAARRYFAAAEETAETAETAEIAAETTEHSRDPSAHPVLNNSTNNSTNTPVWCNDHAAAAAATLRAHDIDPRRGFLPRRDPLRDLSKRYPQCREWEWVGTSLPDLLSAGPAQTRAAVEHMRLVDWSALRRDHNVRLRLSQTLSSLPPSLSRLSLVSLSSRLSSRLVSLYLAFSLSPPSPPAPPSFSSLFSPSTS